MAVLPDTFLQAREGTYRHFIILAVMAGAHVAVMLSSLALAFLADIPVIAMIFFLTAHILLAIAVSRAWRAASDDRPVLQLTGPEKAR